MVLYMLHWYLFTLGHVVPWARAELFTCISEMETLLDTHKRVVDDLDKYIEMGERTLQVLKNYLYVFRMEHQNANKDTPNYLGNPINDFVLIKRLTTDLKHIIDSIQNITEHARNLTMYHEEVKYPTAEDLTGSAQALARLQEVYNLSVRNLSEGILNEAVHSTPMSAGDCYELGRALYNEKDFRHALAWMEQALRKLRNSDDPRPLSEADILEYISFSHYLLDDTKSALKWAMKLLELEPNNTRASDKILDYQMIIAEEDQELQRHQRPELTEVEVELPIQDLSFNELGRKMYQTLCRKEIDIPARSSKWLHCSYLRGHHPFLWLAPIKMELVYWQPDVLLFHDVLSDNEIHIIQDLAKPKLERAGLFNPKTGERMPSSRLLSKSSWLSDKESPTVARVTQRVSDMTGLSMLSAEELYVINYGIGGHYEPHLDVLVNNLSEEKPYKKRIASLMIYMSDVAEGATVFTKLGLRLYPRKGTAVYWMNLHPSGEADLATVHAACPVLYGSKWVAIKWIHQEGQELLRPCSLKYQPGGIIT